MSFRVTYASRAAGWTVKEAAASAGSPRKVENQRTVVVDSASRKQADWVRAREEDLAVAVPQQKRVVMLLQEAARHEIARARARLEKSQSDEEKQVEQRRIQAIRASYKSLISDVRKKLPEVVIAADEQSRIAALIKHREIASEGIGCLSTLLPWSHTISAHDVKGEGVSAADEVVTTECLFMTKKKLMSVNGRRAEVVRNVTPRASPVSTETERHVDPSLQAPPTPRIAMTVPPRFTRPPYQQQHHIQQQFYQRTVAPLAFGPTGVPPMAPPSPQPLSVVVGAYAQQRPQNAPWYQRLLTGFVSI